MENKYLKKVFYHKKKSDKRGKKEPNNQFCSKIERGFKHRDICWSV